MSQNAFTICHHFLNLIIMYSMLFKIILVFFCGISACLRHYLISPTQSWP